MFDPVGKGYISSYDFEKAVAGLKVYTATDEPELIIKHFSKGLSRLSFTEFCGMFVSRDSEYARILNARPRENRRVFSFETESKIQDVLRLHLRAESMAENLRQRLSRSQDFNMHKAFSDLDLDRNGYITLNEFESMLRYNGLLVS
jgi:Ca2+-binding EF-hand superfamily protein